MKKNIWSYKGMIVVLASEDICYFSAYQQKMYVHTERRSYPITSTMKQETEYFRTQGFEKIHQGYLVNLRFLETVGLQEVELRNGKQLPMSESGRERLMRIFQASREKYAENRREILAK